MLRRGGRAGVGLVVAVLALVSQTAARASRLPTPRERSAIESAVTLFPLVSRQNRVSFATVAVSTIDPGYAAARIVVRDPRGKLLVKLAILLVRDVAGWRVVVFGPDPTRCAHVPTAVRLDLLRSTTC
jgi:hypothetical protein